MNTKRLAVPFEVKEMDDAARTFSGLASTWDLDLGGDVIRKGAFKRTVSHWKKGKRPIPLVDQHRYDSVRDVVGKLVEAEETDAGLDTTWQVIDGPDGDEVWRRLKGGYIDGLSIGYTPVKQTAPSEDEARKGIWRYLDEVKLHEVSVVIWPMNEGARVESVKSMIQGLAPEELEEVRALLGIKAIPEAPAHDADREALERAIREVEMMELMALVTR